MTEALELLLTPRPVVVLVLLSEVSFTDHTNKLHYIIETNTSSTSSSFLLFFFLYQPNVFKPSANDIFSKGGGLALGAAGLGLGGAGLAGPGAIAVIGGGAGIGGALGGGDAGVAVINGPSGAIHAGLGAHGAVIPAPIGKWA